MVLFEPIEKSNHLIKNDQLLLRMGHYLNGSTLLVYFDQQGMELGLMRFPKYFFVTKIVFSIQGETLPCGQGDAVFDAKHRLNAAQIQ